MAREVADETGTLMGGNICNTGVFDSENPESIAKVESIFKVCQLDCPIGYETISLDISYWSFDHQQ